MAKEPKVSPVTAQEIEENKRMQRELRDAGYDLGTKGVDGIIGPETKAAYIKMKAEQREKADRDAARETERQKASAAAEAAKAATEAERARVETEKVRAETEAVRARAEEKKRADEAAAAEAKRAADATTAATKLGLNIAFPIIGIVAGHKLAHRIDVKDAASIAARAKNLEAVAKDTAELIKQRDKAVKGGKAAITKKLAANVRAADKLQLTKTRGPLGLVSAGIFLAEGLFTRTVIAPQIENEIGREAALQVSTASIFTATTLIGERMLANATPAVQPSSKSIATIEKARALSAPPQKPSVVGALNREVVKAAQGKAASLAGKTLLGVGIAAGVYAVVQAARAEGIVGAAKATLKAMDPTGGILSRSLDAKPEEPTSLADLAKAQATARSEATKTVTPADVAREVSGGGTTGGYVGAVTGASGLDRLYYGAVTQTQLDRSSAMDLAAAGAKEAAGRPTAPVNPAMPAATLDAQPDGNKLRGFQNEENQRAAQLAKRAKGQ